jgi:hypothetical protein
LTYQTDRLLSEQDLINEEVEMKILVLLALASFSILAADENKELERKIDILADEIAALKASQSNIGSTEQAFGMGQSASKVYFNPQGLSIGGYGEIVYSHDAARNEDGDSVKSNPETEALRNIIYLGYKYNDKWVVNTEIEIEHVNEIYTEFMYVDYLHSDEMNFRFGLTLIPAGLTNELHEPIYFNSVNRPEVETYLIPSTWRENAVGVFGSLGDFNYKAFLMNGPNGDGIASNGNKGIRSGRKKGGSGNSAETQNASTGMIVLNGNYTFDDSSSFGGTLMKGSASSSTQENLEMTLTELHGVYKKNGLGFKALYTLISFDNADDFNETSTDKVVGLMDGYYIELEYDIESTKGATYTPFVRHTEYDLQKEFDSNEVIQDSTLDRTKTVVGLAYKPIPNIVFKADYSFNHNKALTAANQFNLGLGFVY